MIDLTKLRINPRCDNCGKEATDGDDRFKYCEDYRCYITLDIRHKIEQKSKEFIESLLIKPPKE